jgi:hypothetical protein
MGMPRINSKSNTSAKKQRKKANDGGRPEENPEDQSSVDYCKSVARVMIIEEIRQETSQFLRGFYEVIPKQVVGIFSP